MVSVLNHIQGQKLIGKPNTNTPCLADAIRMEIIRKGSRDYDITHHTAYQLDKSGLDTGCQQISVSEVHF